MRRWLTKEDGGSMMIDGMIAMLFTILILVFLMSIGFLFYQQWIVSQVANDTATRVAQSYVYPNTDPIMGYINVDQIADVPIFRYIGTYPVGEKHYLRGGLADENSEKGEKVADWALKQSSLAYPVSDPVIQVETVYDSLARRHVEVTITAEYEIPLGGALQYFGLDKTITYTATGEAVCIDILDYVNTVDSVRAISQNVYGSTTMQAINAIIEMVGSIADLFS